MAESDASAEVDTSLQPSDEPSPVAVFFEGAIFLSSKRTPAPSEQRRVAASAYGFIDADDCPFFGRDLLEFDDHAAACPCRMQVTAPCGFSLPPLQEERWRSLSPPRPRRHFHLPCHRFYTHHVLLDLNIFGFGSRPSRLAPKPLARTKVSVSRDNPHCQPDRPQLFSRACDVPDAFL